MRCIQTGVCLNCSRSKESITDLKTLIKTEDDDDDDDDDEGEEEEDDDKEEEEDDEAEEKWMEQSNNPRFRKVFKKSHISVMVSGLHDDPIQYLIYRTVNIRGKIKVDSRFETCLETE